MLNSTVETTYLIAGGSDTPVDLLNKLAQHADAKIRARVAENPNTPFWTVALLVTDGNDEVRLSAAANPRLPKIFQVQLANDPSDDVRYALAEDFLIPLDVLKILATDDNVYVQHRALKTLSTLGNGTESSREIHTYNPAPSFVAA
jgi:hypothetical protein